MNLIFDIVWYATLTAILLFALYSLINFIDEHISAREVAYVAFLGLMTTLRVVSVLIFCSIVWVPIGVWIGFRPHVAQYAQWLMQILAAFPAYLLFPLVVMAIVKFQLNVEIWVTPLLILGTQWYVAFNVIAGTRAIPKDLHLAIKNFNVKGGLKWRRFIIPGIFPYFITGAITASGGAWNTSIVAEYVSWGTVTLKATGLGAYITEYTTLGDYPRIVLGICVMCIYVVVFNRLLWRPLYNFAEKRYRVE